MSLPTNNTIDLMEILRRGTPSNPIPPAFYPLGAPVPVPSPSKTPAGEMLRKAADIVEGDRNRTHGDKERSFVAIASLWTTFLAARKDPTSPISAADVCAMMVLLKFARSEHGSHVRDHGIDAAGYSAIWGELRETSK